MEKAHLDEVSFLEATGCERGCADADATGHNCGLIPGHAVLVERDRGQVQHLLNPGTVNATRLEVHQDQVVVRAATNDVVPQLLQPARATYAAGLALSLAKLGPNKAGASDKTPTCPAPASAPVGQRARVGHNLPLVLHKLVSLNQLECDCEPGDCVVVGAALEAREDGLVDVRLKLLAEEDHAWAQIGRRRSLESPLAVAKCTAGCRALHRAPPTQLLTSARAAQRFVRSGGDDVCVLKRAGHHARGHQPGDMRHVGHQHRAHGVGDLPHACIVKVPGVCRRAGDDELGPARSQGRRCAEAHAASTPHRVPAART